MSDKTLTKNGEYNKWGKAKLIVILIILILIVLNIWLISSALGTTVSATHDAYTQTFEEQRIETYQKYYKMSYDIAQKKNHVSNRVTIDIQKVKEVSALEVLRVSDVNYIYDENDIRDWVSIYGYGVYTVDLRHSEIIVDNERKSVLVRVLHPKLDRISLSYGDVEPEFKENFLNGSISEGVNAAQDDLKKAYDQLEEKMGSSQRYYSRAESSAEERIKSMVKNLNPEVPDLIVEVEFVD